MAKMLGLDPLASRDPDDVRFLQITVRGQRKGERLTACEVMVVTRPGPQPVVKRLTVICCDWREEWSWRPPGGLILAEGDDTAEFHNRRLLRAMSYELYGAADDDEATED